MNLPSLSDLLPREDYHFQLRLTHGSPAEFFAPSSEHASLAAERNSLLTSLPQRYAAWQPEAEPLLAETLALAAAWSTLSTDESDRITRTAGCWEKCLALGAAWEPDFLLLKPDPQGTLRLRGGCVCFPSSWVLEEKVGRTLAEIHGVVPGLNVAIGPPIENFLKRLRPGLAFQRFNWGLSRRPDLNQHPALNLPRLTPPLRLEDVWFRVEHQALVALPQSGGVLFGIRIRVHPLAEVKADATAAQGLRHALATMPEAMARYKGLAAAKADLLHLLDN